MSRPRDEKSRDNDNTGREEKIKTKISGQDQLKKQTTGASKPFFPYSLFGKEQERKNAEKLSKELEEGAKFRKELRDGSTDKPVSQNLTEGLLELHKIIDKKVKNYKPNSGEADIDTFIEETLLPELKTESKSNVKLEKALDFLTKDKDFNQQIRSTVLNSLEEYEAENNSKRKPGVNG